MAGETPQTDTRPSQQQSEVDPGVRRRSWGAPLFPGTSVHALAHPRNPAGRHRPPRIPRTPGAQLVSGPRSSAQNLRREGGGGLQEPCSRWFALGASTLAGPGFCRVGEKREELGGKTSRGHSGAGEPSGSHESPRLPPSTLGFPHLLPQIYLLS